MINAILARPQYLHLESTLGSKVGLQDFLESLSGINVDAKSGGLTDNIGLGVHKLK